MTLYSDLGVDEKASTAEIKRAYRRKSRNAHPDHGGDVEEFKRGQAAYDVLGNEQRRIEYDQFGTTEKIDDEKQARGVFAQLIEKFCLVDGNIFELIRKQTKVGMENCDRQIVEAGAQIDRYERRIKKVAKQNAKTKNQTGLGIVLAVMNQHLAAAQQQKNIAAKQREILGRVLELVDGLEFKADGQPQFVATGGTWVTFRSS